MKTKILFPKVTAIIFVISLLGCFKENGTGKVTFWYNTNGTAATVKINDKTGTITSYIASGTPSCGEPNCANFMLPVGSYNYTASSTFSNWSGSVNITKDGCQLILLQ